MQDNKFLPDLEEQELDQQIDENLNLITFEEDDNEIIHAIVNSKTKTELETQFELFNMNQSKKNALRLIKLESLLGKVEDQAIKRIEDKPDQISNRELLDYMQVISQQIDRSQKVVDSLHDKPMIRSVQNNTKVNINLGTDLNKDNKENIISAFKGILKVLGKNNEPETTISSNNCITDDENITKLVPIEKEEIEEVVESNLNNNFKFLSDEEIDE